MVYIKYVKLEFSKHLNMNYLVKPCLYYEVMFCSHFLGELNCGWSFLHVKKCFIYMPCPQRCSWWSSHS